MRPTNKEINGIGEKIKQARTEKGITLRDLGKEIGVNHTMILRWENGLSYPNMIQIGRLCTSLKKSIEFFI